ncbi:hypothetical protein EJ04DRAFT_605281 [Polyplosphaeria fusca]|uniref:DUF7730 domain-containing protein n=1 Tax=Polyplosphaeria fusca TaxID=682080 RepID=A0A9P4QYU8_9PLEO|nr:hypothetical protein EJ04DRAFT_605281 [Polyplosphaeria fusca]
MASNQPFKVEWSQSYKSTPSAIGFLDLPRELRQIVYDYAFRVSGAIFFFDSERSYFRRVIQAKVVRLLDEGPAEPQSMSSAVTMALLRSCRQVHAECCEVLFGSNVFQTYESALELAPAYSTFLRHIIYIAGTDQRIYMRSMDTFMYIWRSKFWPHVTERSAVFLQRYQNLESLTIPIKSDLYGKTWRPPIMSSDNKTREQRVRIAAGWLKSLCVFQNDRLRKCLHLEILPYSKKEYEYSKFAPEVDEMEWDCREFGEAFELMKTL